MSPVAKTRMFFMSEWTLSPPATTLNPAYPKMPKEDRTRRLLPREDWSSPWKRSFWTLNMAIKRSMWLYLIPQWSTNDVAFLFVCELFSWLDMLDLLTDLMNPSSVARIDTMRMTQWEESARNTANWETWRENEIFNSHLVQVIFWIKFWNELTYQKINVIVIKRRKYTYCFLGY